MVDPALESVEAVCIGYFTLEYALRLILSPQRIFFVKVSPSPGPYEALRPLCWPL